MKIAYMDINTIDILEKCNDREMQALLKEIEANKHDNLEAFEDGDWGYELFKSVSSMYTMNQFKNEVYRECAIRFYNLIK